MPLTLKTQKLKEFKLGDLILEYKLLSDKKSVEMVRKYIVNGKIDPNLNVTIIYDFAEKMVTGWKNVLDEDKKPVLFKKELIADIDLDEIMSFAAEVIDPHLDRILKSIEKIAKKAGIKLKN